MGERICRCLLAEMEDGRPLYEIIREYLASLPPEALADAPVYAERLEICRACARLRNGTCALCGCYVEERAAKRNQRCPDVPGKW